MMEGEDGHGPETKANAAVTRPHLGQLQRVLFDLGVQPAPAVEEPCASSAVEGRANIKALS
jgi:hypothetical protein